MGSTAGQGGPRQRFPITDRASAGTMALIVWKERPVCFETLASMPASPQGPQAMLSAGFPAARRRSAKASRHALAAAYSPSIGEATRAEAEEKQMKKSRGPSE